LEEDPQHLKGCLRRIFSQQQGFGNGLADGRTISYNSISAVVPTDIINLALVVIFIFCILISFGSGPDIIKYQPITRPQTL
jgi:hypothetical protein